MQARHPVSCVRGAQPGARVVRAVMRGLWLCLMALVLLPAPAWAQQKVRVGVYQNSPKVALASDGKPEGIFVDLIEAVAEKEGWRLEYVAGTWAEGLARLGMGEIDLMPDVAATPERELLYAFQQEPVLASWNQVYARRGGGVRSMLDLQSKRVAVVEGSVQHTQFAQMAESFNLPLALLPYADYDVAFQAVASGQADAVITNRFFGVRNAGKYGLEDTAIIFSPSKLYFAAPKKGREALLAAIDRHLIGFKKSSDSIYYRSLRRWAVDEVRTATPSWLLPLLVSVVLALVAGVAWVVLLRRQVAAKTREIQQRSDEVLVINRTLRATGSRRELNAVLDEAIKGALALTGFDGGVLCVRDAQSGQLRVGARRQALTEADRAADGGPLCDTACPAMLESVAKGRRHALLAAGSPDAPLACGNVHDATVRWHAYFPLAAQDRTIGMLCLFSHKTEPPPVHVMELVEDICGPVALAMENARLYEQAQGHTRELEQRVIARTAEIAELSTFLQAIIDHIANPIFYKGPDLRFRGCNNAYERAFCVVRADVIGKTVMELAYLPLADRQAYQREDAAALASGNVVSREAAMPFADGRVHQTLYSVSGFSAPGGSPAGLVGVIVDITPMKDAQAALRVAMEAAEAADQIKSAFLATMSHELRTPLNSIIGFTGIVLQGMAGPLNVEQAKQLGMVRDSARHLLALINDVLDISKIEAGELPVACESFDLARSIDKVAAIMRPMADKKGLALTVNVAPGVRAMVSDERRVEQVLLNLLGNAIKFSKAGSVLLQAEMVSDFQVDRAHPPVPAVRLSVADTGIGIRPEDMALLFVPFRQIDSALSRKHDGTGLGLAICRRLTALMGGTIEAQSEWGHGSVFTVTLPLQTPANREPS
ncbi:ATP-binding protein [Rhodoferax sp.]|uniref:ATP-binding protein n=1 Tax=Rhodoferax sp. TaxID=50421 RepID=UPI0027619BDC|nr:transporter substrate-binding domain-containing protein [Rhodoferax sp.]